jgi:hypothetical protein
MQPRVLSMVYSGGECTWRRLCLIREVRTPCPPHRLSERRVCAKARPVPAPDCSAWSGAKRSRSAPSLERFPVQDRGCAHRIHPISPPRRRVWRGLVAGCGPSRVWARWDQEARRLAGSWREQGARIGLEVTIDLETPKISKTRNCVHLFA